MSESLAEALLRPEGADDAAPPQVGSALKALRETRGLTLGEVSARIKYSAAQLRHFEANEWAQLPEGVPLRGLVKNYARFLETDAEAMLRLLDGSIGPGRAHPAVHAATARHALPQMDMTPRGEPAHRTWAWLLLLLVLFCAFGFYAINRGWVPDQWLAFDWLKALRP